MLDNRKFYWGSTRKAIIAFANLFNNIMITREDTKGKDNTIKVPLVYGPKDKFIARIQQQPDLDSRNVALVFPRMAFEITSLSYDRDRMTNANNVSRYPVDGTMVKKYSPVPYNLGITLSVYTKSQDEGLQIIEQILPTFRPSYVLSVNTIPELGLTEDLNITLTDVDMEDTYEGDLNEKRMVLWTLSFVLKLNYHPATDNKQRGLIKRVEITGFSDITMNNKVGEITHEVSPFDADVTDEYEIISTIDGFD